MEDGYRDTIELSMRLPDDAAGETLEFPVLQTCEVGETNWNQVAEEGEEEPESPAPTIVVTEATGDEHGHGATDRPRRRPTSTATTTRRPRRRRMPRPGRPTRVARVLGIGGLVVGVVGIVLAITARRSRSDA